MTPWSGALATLAVWTVLSAAAVAQPREPFAIAGQQVPAGHRVDLDLPPPSTGT